MQKDIGKATAGWAESDFTAASGVLTVAQHLLAVDKDISGFLSASSVPSSPFRRSFIESEDSFEAIGPCREITSSPSLRQDQHQTILSRRSRRRIFRTRPVQYEIVVYLAERIGNFTRGLARSGTGTGKLSSRDPKQSI